MARKLVKEMEDHKVSRASRVSVRNRYTIFLCEDDFDRLAPQRDQLIGKLERHLSKHVRAKRYEISGDILVDIVLDTDLKLGHFGILGEREAPGFAGQELGSRLVDDAPEQPRGPLVSAFDPLPVAAQPQPPVAEPEPAVPARRVRQAEPEQGGATKIIGPGEAADLRLARTTIVIKSGNRVREFSQGRVVVGRARDADFCIDNPDVSRRHAAITWSNGKLLLEDLGSTNGTMVNGYPVSSTVITPQDVVVIGDCRMNVEIR